MVKHLKKMLFAVAMLLVAQVAFSQNITLKFTGATNDGRFARLDSVQVQNVSRSWSETVVYPDTVLIFQQTGITDAHGSTADIASYPNPFNGTTNVAVTMPQSGDATLQVYNLAGQRVAERTMTLPTGKNLFEVRLQTAQVYLLAVTTAEGRSTVKLLNRGTGSDNSISFYGNSNIEEKRQSANPFQSGDVLKIIGYTTNNGTVVASNEIQCAIISNENITLIFVFSGNSNANTLFSVSDSTRVVFSPGNLQWSAKNGGYTATTHTIAGGGTAAGTWRFAPNQCDAIGANNSNISSSYSGWIDLFGWGTSGYNCKYPYMTSRTDSDYGNGNNNISGTNYDWGVYNAIYNPKTSTTDAPGTWRTLTHDEWYYLINTRTTTSGIRYAKATVNGVRGLILVPDNWSISTYALSNTNTSSAAYASNVITAAQWAILENAGCAFLPAAVGRDGTSVRSSVGSYGTYWSATYCSSTHAYVFHFGFDDCACSALNFFFGNSVRLVKDPKPPIITTTVASGINYTTATTGGNVTNDCGFAVTARGVCWSTFQNPTLSDSHTNDGSGTGSFTSSLTGLTAGTTYYVRAYATNAVGTAYGNQITFTTTAILPTIYTDTIYNITSTSAVSVSLIPSDGGSAVTTRGVCWDTSPNPTVRDSHTTNGYGTGNFTSSITGLTPNTTYYVRAYAINIVGIAYGNQLTFTTHQAVAPTVTTTSASNVTTTTATSGGNVTNDNGSAVTARGVCWSTSYNPTLSDSHTYDSSGTGSFTSSLTGLTAETTYYVRAYAINSVDTAYGSQITFTTPAAEPFSVSDSTRVVFSSGNLQWSAKNGGSIPTTHVTVDNTAAGTWRFAPNQWDTIGANNSNISSSYSGWIDQFGWGTSGYNNQYPYMTSTNYYDYRCNGDRITNYDWGIYNAIYNPKTSTTDAPGTWRTLTKDEWYYLLYTRRTASGIRYAKAIVNGVPGLIIVPDNWNTFTYALSSTNTYNASYSTNVINLATWTTLENAGCTFLPAAGSRNGTSVRYVGSSGFYWSATYYSSNYAYGPYFSSGSLDPRDYGSRCNGYSVRLVKDYNNGQFALFPTVTTDTTSNITTTTATSGGNVTDLGSSAVTARGVCWSTSPNPTISDNHTTNGSGRGSFTSIMTRLTAGTTYYVRAYATNAAGTAYGNQITFTTTAVAPTVTTTSASSITSTTATTGGNVTRDGGDSVTARGVCWSTSQNPTLSNSHTSNGSGTGSFTSNITGLSASTTYYVRAYAINSVDTAYGNQITFNTTAPAPTVTTTAASSITTTSAISGGNVTSDGGSAVTARGVCWSTSPNPTIRNNHTIDSTGMGHFTSNITGLTGGTTYYVRAYATNGAGTAYGNQITFATTVAPTVTTTSASSITSTTATSGGNVTDTGSSAVTARGVCWSTSRNPTVSDSHTIDSSGIGIFTSNITGLNPSTTYYVRAYATNTTDTAYGAQITFTTLAMLPTVTTTPVSYITSTTATSGGNVINDGGATVTARGICWGTTVNPTVSGSHSTIGSGTGSFTSNITGLAADAIYYVRAYATNAVGTAYGNQITFTTARFTVSANKRVMFSHGNLQWSASGTHSVAGGGTAAGTWRFAPNQWDTIGAANSNVSSFYSGWIDLFGWGTSGYNSKYPYMTIRTNNDYGNGNNNIENTNYDWGVYNAIYDPNTSTTDAPRTWRTLTKDEWVYLLNTRSTASGIRYAKAIVNGVSGLIIVPDNWSNATYPLNSTNTTNAAYTTNVINLATWTTLENAGCAFLPAAGNRNDTSVHGVGSAGFYWSATYYSSNYAYGPYFYSGSLDPRDYGSRCNGYSVRLVKDVQ